MKKRCFALLLALVLAGAGLAAQGVEPVGHVVDLAGLLDSQEQSQLEQQAQDIEAAYSCGLYIVAVNDYRDYAAAPFDAACEIYGANGFGYGPERDGLVLLLSMDDRDFATALYGPWAHTAFSDYALERQEEEFLDNFRYDDWYGGFADFLTTSEQALAAAAAGTPVEAPVATAAPAQSQPVLQGTHHGSKTLTLRAGLTVFFQDWAGALVLALIFCFALKASMNSVKAKTTAQEYMRVDESQLSRCTDQFTHATHTRRVIQSNTSRSGGGGGHSHSHHSGGFSGRSGKF